MSKLYKIYQTVNRGYDTFDSVVVVADSLEDARKIHPSGFVPDDWWTKPEADFSEWADYAHIEAEEIGEAIADLEVGSIIVASFNAG